MSAGEIVHCTACRRPWERRLSRRPSRSPSPCRCTAAAARSRSCSRRRSAGSLPVDQHGSAGFAGRDEHPAERHRHQELGAVRELFGRLGDRRLRRSSRSPATRRVTAIAGDSSLRSPVASMVTTEKLYVDAGARPPTVTLVTPPGSRRISRPFCRITWRCESGRFCARSLAAPAATRGSRWCTS